MILASYSQSKMRSSFCSESHFRIPLHKMHTFQICAIIFHLFRPYIKSISNCSLRLWKGIWLCGCIEAYLFRINCRSSVVPLKTYGLTGICLALCLPWLPESWCSSVISYFVTLSTRENSTVFRTLFYLPCSHNSRITCQDYDFC